MCGIVGYVGEREVAPLLVQGLRRLEYRGYDSAGIALHMGDTITRIRAVGKIENLAQKVHTQSYASTQGIAHTRWATHGGVTEQNAHPHSAAAGKLTLVHNGIIENYRELATELAGITLESETDSEVLAHIIAQQYSGNLRDALMRALKKVRGTYGLVVMHADHPGVLMVARMGSPIVLGNSAHGTFVASDATPMLAHTKDVIFLDDGECAQVTKDGIETFTVQNKPIVKAVQTIDWDEALVEKAGFDHFMLKEIHDQPTVFLDAIRGRINKEEGTAHLGGLNMTREQMQRVNRIVLIACGTASIAGEVGRYAFERLVGIPTEVAIASEFRYRDPIVDENTLVFAISQSGETADTLAALKEAKRKGAFVRGIVNVVGSTIARETDGGTYIHAGPELAVASTKAYTNMVAILLLYAIEFGRIKRVSLATGQRLVAALEEIPEKMKLVFAQKEHIHAIAQKYKHYKDFFFIGRGINNPVAQEGSLKLKEISYIHSESYAGGELKHGPIALLSEQFPVLAIMTKNQLYEKMRSNVEEVKARKAPVILLANIGDESAKELAEDVIYVPETMELLEPLINTIALQLFSYYIAVGLGRDVDRPRNLAKSVTVE